MIGGLISYFPRHRTAANLLLVVLLALGLASIPRMRAQFFPDVISDEIDVSVTWSGAGAESVDTAIVGVLEPVLLTVEGVAGLEARSTEGRASFEIEFEPGWDMSRAVEDVDSAMPSNTALPEGADDPEIQRSAWRPNHGASREAAAANRIALDGVPWVGEIQPNQAGRILARPMLNIRRLAAMKNPFIPVKIPIKTAKLKIATPMDPRVCSMAKPVAHAGCVATSSGQGMT